MTQISHLTYIAKDVAMANVIMFFLNACQAQTKYSIKLGRPSLVKK